MIVQRMVQSIAQWVVQWILQWIARDCPMDCAELFDNLRAILNGLRRTEKFRGITEDCAQFFNALRRGVWDCAGLFGGLRGTTQWFAAELFEGMREIVQSIARDCSMGREGLFHGFLGIARDC